MSGLVHRILELPGWLVLLVAGLMVFAEDALFVGFVVPGETVALLAGAAAKLGHVSLSGVLIVVIVAAIVGDSLGYEIGRHLGPRVLRQRIFDKRRKRLDDAQDFLARRGGSAVFLGRWIAFFRAVMPFLAGTARMRYPKFLAWNAAGGLAWGATVVLLGYAAGASYAQVEKTFGRDAAFVALAVMVAALVIWRIRRHGAERRAGAGDRKSVSTSPPTATAPMSWTRGGTRDVHHGSPVLMFLLAGELGLLVFVLIAGSLWWAVPRLLHRLRRHRRRSSR